MKKYKKVLDVAMTLLILTISFYIGRFGAKTVETNGRAKLEKTAADGKEREDVKGSAKRVVVDAGHGGFDSGKVGIDGILEKDMNLAIAVKLQKLLQQEGFEVLMTRQSDAGLYDENESNKKQQDMKRRCALINEAEAALAVSIHQNSYTQESVKGPQVFYYETSAQGQRLAAALQETLNEKLEIERPREIKGNNTYYLLRKTSTPTVIVECGFLSNVAEARKLATEEYQQKVAQAVFDGILKYLEKE